MNPRPDEVTITAAFLPDCSYLSIRSGRITLVPKATYSALTFMIDSVCQASNSAYGPPAEIPAFSATTPISMLLALSSSPIMVWYY